MNSFEKSWCSHCLDEIKQCPLCEYFIEPIDFSSLPDYRNITMTNKLSKNDYRSVESFFDDIYLILDNAIAYNGENSFFFYMCSDIRTLVEKKQKERPKNEKDANFRKLMNLSTKLNRHLANLPNKLRESAEIGKLLPFPAADLISKLSQDQINDITIKAHEPSIESLHDNWFQYGYETQKSLSKEFKKD